MMADLYHVVFSVCGVLEKIRNYEVTTLSNSRSAWRQAKTRIQDNVINLLFFRSADSQAKTRNYDKVA
jgi:hypothetical protein